MHAAKPTELDPLRLVTAAVSKSTEGYEYATVVIPNAHVVRLTQELAEERQRFCAELHACLDATNGGTHDAFVPDLLIPARIRWWQSMEPARPQTLQPVAALREAANSETELSMLYDQVIEGTADSRLLTVLERQRAHIRRAHHRLTALRESLEQPAHTSSHM
jgi:hypothetical protein